MKQAGSLKMSSNQNSLLWYVISKRTKNYQNQNGGEGGIAEKLSGSSTKGSNLHGETEARAARRATLNPVSEYGCVYPSPLTDRPAHI